VIVPRATPPAAIAEASIAGASVFTIEGTIATAGKVVGKVAPEIGWFDLSTLKEPYRLEGKKTMGLELAEQLGWTLPDILLYPTGGGTGLVGIPKGFDELTQMGWVSGRTRFVAVQAEGCAPVVKAFHDGAETTTAWENPAPVAAGLRVPSPFAGRQMLRILRESGGDAIAVSARAIDEAQRLLARLEGVWTSPEGAALVAALASMKDQGKVAPDNRVVIMLTGAGIKYTPPELPTPIDLTGSDEEVRAAVRGALGA
jgi:threonine synthase